MNQVKPSGMVPLLNPNFRIEETINTINSKSFKNNSLGFEAYHQEKFSEGDQDFK